MVIFQRGGGGNCPAGYRAISEQALIVIISFSERENNLSPGPNLNEQGSRKDSSRSSLWVM